MGQNLGAQKYDRVKKGVVFGITSSCILAELVGLACYLFAPELIGFFCESKEAVSFGVEHMRTICLFYCLLSFTHCIVSVLRGAGKTMGPMFILLACWCVIRVSYITIAVRFVNELTTVSWAYPITWSLSTVIFLIYFFTCNWLPKTNVKTAP